MSNILTNGAIFSTCKRTDSHTVRGRHSPKDGVVIYERIFRNEPFCDLKMSIESHDFAVIRQPSRAVFWLVAQPLNSCTGLYRPERLPDWFLIHFLHGIHFGAISRIFSVGGYDGNLSPRKTVNGELL